MKPLVFGLLAVLVLQESGRWRVVLEQGGKLQSVREDGTDLRGESGSPHRRGVLSPDGSRLAYTLFADGDSDVWVSDPDGRNARKLTHNAVVDAHPRWTRDGKRLVFSSTRDGKSQIWIMEADGTRPVQLTKHAGGARAPEVSPTGDLVAYVELHPERSKLPPSTLRTMDLSGGDSKVLVEKTQMLGHTWSTQGDRLAVSLVQELRILEIPSGTVVQSFKFEEIHRDLHAHAARGVTWRPDGNAIACTIQFLGGRMKGTEVFGDKQVFILPFKGKPVIVEMGGPASPVRWMRE